MDKNSKTDCLGCDWEGKISECRTEKTEDDVCYICPECNAILFWGSDFNRR